MAAAEALAAATPVLPVLLPEVLKVLAQSIKRRELPEVQLKALRDIFSGVCCPPLDATRTADIFVDAISTVVEALMAQVTALLASPPTLVALFGLLADAVSPTPNQKASRGLFGVQLRSLFLRQVTLAGTCLALVAQALPDCTSADAAANGKSEEIKLKKWEVGEGNQVSGNFIHPCINALKNHKILLSQNFCCLL